MACLRAGTQGHHGDDGAHADDDAEHRQETAKQIGADGLQRHR